MRVPAGALGRVDGRPACSSGFGPASADAGTIIFRTAQRHPRSQRGLPALAAIAAGEVRSRLSVPGARPDLSARAWAVAAVACP